MARLRVILVANFRIFDVYAGGNLTLNTMSLSGGSENVGGAIYLAPGATLGGTNNTVIFQKLCSYRKFRLGPTRRPICSYD